MTQIRCFLCGVFLFFAPAYALFNGPSNLPELPEKNLFLPEDAWYSLKLSYEVDFVLDRKCRSSSGLSNTHMHSMFNGAEISFGFTDYVEIYTALGAFTSFVSASYEDRAVSLKISESFGGSLGSRIMAICWGETKLGFTAQYFYGWPNLSYLRIGGSSTSSCSQSRESEWQVGFSFSQRFGALTPYVGGTYSRFALDLSHLDNVSSLHTIKVENSHPFGVCMGLAIAGRKCLFLDIEVRFVSEYAYSALLGLRF
jgi:hypothetical protein